VRNAFATAIAVLMSACSAGPLVAPSAAGSPTPTLAVAATTSPVPTASLTATPRPTPTAVTDLSQVFRPLTTGWHPTGPTVVIGRCNDTGDVTVLALPLGAGGRTGAPTPLVTLALGSWALRPDGGAVVIAVGTWGRLATWNARTGEARWLTSVDAGGGSPIWSKDGSSLYYSSSGDDGRPGIFHIGAGGSGRKQLFTHERLGQLEGLTPDGAGLVWSLGQAGGSVEILDLATGVNRHIENVALVSSWRARQPRLLLGVGGCCAGRPGGSLVAWDDKAMTSRVVAERGQYGDPAWSRGAWDPTGTRIAAGRFDTNVSPYEPTLVILDPETGATEPIAGTLGVGQILWLPEGIVFTLARTRQPGFEVMLLPVGGGPAVSLYQDMGSVYRIDVVRP